MGDRNHFATGWFYYLGEIALKRLQNRVLQHLFGNEQSLGDRRRRDGQKTEDSEMHDLREFDKQLDQWYVYQGQQQLSATRFSSLIGFVVGYNICQISSSFLSSLPKMSGITSAGCFVVIDST